MVFIYRLYLVLYVFSSVLCEYKQESRRARLFSFNTVDEDIRIDLDFTIPFASIPVKKTIDTAFGSLGSSTLGFPIININPASLALGGAVVIATTVMIPLLIKSYSFHDPQQRYAKLLDVAEFDNDFMLDFISEMLMEGRHVRGCALKVACWTGNMPLSDDITHVWKNILSNKLVSSAINVTALEDAMLSGRHGRDCSSYKPCPIKNDQLSKIIDNFMSLANRFIRTSNVNNK